MKSLLVDTQALAALLAAGSALIVVIGMMATNQKPTGWPLWFWRSMVCFGWAALALRLVCMATGKTS